MQRFSYRGCPVADEYFLSNHFPLGQLAEKSQNDKSIKRSKIKKSKIKNKDQRSKDQENFRKTKPNTLEQILFREQAIGSFMPGRGGSKTMNQTQSRVHSFLCVRKTNVTHFEIEESTQRWAAA